MVVNRSPSRRVSPPRPSPTSYAAALATTTTAAAIVNTSAPAVTATVTTEAVPGGTRPLVSSYATRSKTVSISTMLGVGGPQTKAKVTPVAVAAPEKKKKKKKPAEPKRTEDQGTAAAAPPSPTPSPTPTPLPSLLDIPVSLPDHADWTTVHRRRSDSSLSSTSSRTPLIKSFSVSGIPREHATPKALDLLCKKVGLLPTNIRVFGNGSAVISSIQGDLKEKIAAIGHQLGKPITATSRLQQSRPAPQPKKPSFSCVLRGVELDITADDVMEALRMQGITATNAWRIRSKATDRVTKLVRVLSDSSASLDLLLSRGLRMFSHTYHAEPSHAPKPQPVQCGRCLKFHPTNTCPERKSVCGICGGGHSTATCKPDAPLRCANCQGDHVAFSMRCPQRPQEATSAEAAAPLKTVDRPVSEDSPLSSDPVVPQIIRFVLTSLLNLFPNHRALVQSTVHPLIGQLFGLQVATSYAGNYVHVTLN